MDLDYDDIVYIRDVSHVASPGHEEEAEAVEVIAREVEAAFIRSASEALNLISPGISYGSSSASTTSHWLRRRASEDVSMPIYMLSSSHRPERHSDDCVCEGLRRHWS